MTKYPPVKVKVKLGAATNVARAGSGKSAKISSSSCSGFNAAFSAAAKYFGKIRRGEVLRMRCLQQGDCCANKPEIYTAFLE